MVTCEGARYCDGAGIHGPVSLMHSPAITRGTNLEPQSVLDTDENRYSSSIQADLSPQLRNRLTPRINVIVLALVIAYTTLRLVTRKCANSDVRGSLPQSERLTPTYKSSLAPGVCVPGQHASLARDQIKVCPGASNVSPKWSLNMDSREEPSFCLRLNAPYAEVEPSCFYEVVRHYALASLMPN